MYILYIIYILTFDTGARVAITARNVINHVQYFHLTTFHPGMNPMTFIGVMSIAEWQHNGTRCGRRVNYWSRIPRRHLPFTLQGHQDLQPHG